METEKLLPDVLCEKSMKFLRLIEHIHDMEKIEDVLIVQRTMEIIKKEKCEIEIAELRAEKEYETGNKILAYTLMRDWYYTSRQIYRFEPCLTESLTRNTLTNDVLINCDIFLSLPRKSFFVQLSETEGIFYSIRENEAKILVMTYWHNDGTDNSMSIVFEKGKIEKLSNVLENQIRFGLRCFCNIKSEEPSAQKLSQSILKKQKSILIHNLQFLFYLSSLPLAEISFSSDKTADEELVTTIHDIK